MTVSVDKALRVPPKRGRFPKTGYSYASASKTRMVSKTRYENRKENNYGTEQETGKAGFGLECPTVSSEEFLALDDNNVCTAPIMADKDIWELAQG
ncbi:hypothetical protein TNCV_3423541 [Trichonephila clavipes]|nr:hypothetical protein TNCV_1395071 [Trichonephila clavipes]GFU81188.1 hypothetical protein TNCV_3423541 [Trichonephila clavipes]